MKKRNIVIGVITIIISMIGMIHFSICGLAQKTLECTFDLDDHVKLNSIYINNTKIPIEKIKKDNHQLLIDEETGLLFANEKTEIKLELSVVDSLYMEFIADDHANIDIRKNGIIQEMDGNIYSDYHSIFSIVKESFNFYSILWLIVLLPVVYIGIYLIYRFFEKVNENTLKIRHIVAFSIGVFIIFVSTFYFILSVSKILVIMMIILSLITGVYFLRENIKNNLQNIFLYIAIIMGISMAFLVPPFNVPDESSHFCKSFEMSYLKNEDDGGYTKIPKFLDDFCNKYLHSVHLQGTAYSGINYYSDIYLNCDYEDTTELVDVNYSNTKYLAPLSYLPSTIVILIGRNIGLSPLLLLLLSRFVDLMIVVIGAYLALKMTPKFQKIFFVVCLFPIFLQQSAAINQDYLTNIACIMFVAYVLKCKYSDKSLDIKDKILLGVLMLVISLCKFGYFPIILTLFLIPSEKFKNKKEALIIKIGFLVFSVILSYLVSSAMAPEIDAQDGEHYSLSYILSNPIDTLKIYYNTMVTRIQSDVLISLADGFLYSTVAHKALLSFIVTLCYLLLIFCDDANDAKLNKKERIILIIPAIMLFGIVYSAAFIGWTTFGSRTIWGIQSRYFIPAVLILYIGISSNILKVESKNKNLMYCYLTILIHSISIFTIVTSVYR